MSATIRHIADLERVNYAAILPIAQVTPGLDLVMREDVIMTGSQAFPTPDTTHACLLQATPSTVDDLLADVIDYFGARQLPKTIFVSPACTPADLPARLLARGFVRQGAGEAWMALYDLPGVQVPDSFSNVDVGQITPEEVLTVAEIFMAAFEMPADLAPYMAQVMAPSVGLDTAHHYIARIDGQPVGTCSLLRHEDVAILGSAGVLPAHRRSGVITSLTIRAILDARERGVETMMLQTEAGAPLERLLRISGFKKVFTRTCYTLP